MPRIFKGSGSTLRLLIHKCVNYNALGNLKVVLYTTNPEIAVQVTEGIVVEGNRVVFTLPSTAFASMDDGVINYIIEGIIDNDFFSTERQSDYYLKTPTSYIAEGGSYQEKYLNVNENGLYEVIPDEGKDAMTKVSVNVDVQPNLGHLYADFEDYDGEGNYWRYGFEDGFDGFNYVKINASAYGEQKRSEGYDQGHSDGRNDGIELGKAYARDEAEELYITENGVFEGPLYKKVEVNVDTTSITIGGDTGINLRGSTFKVAPKLKVVGPINQKRMFADNTKLIDVTNLADLDVSNETELGEWFTGSGAYSDGKPLDMSPLANWDVSNVKKMDSIFMSVGSVEDYSFMANWDTSNLSSTQSLFYHSNGTYNKIKYVPVIKGDSLTSIMMVFSNDTQPTTTLEYFGGFQNMKCNWNDNRGLSATPNLTYESCISILNCLYDFTGNGLTPSSSQGNLKVHQNFLDLVGDEINIGISKGWRITA